MNKTLKTFTCLKRTDYRKGTKEHHDDISHQSPVDTNNNFRTDHDGGVSYQAHIDPNDNAKIDHHGGISYQAPIDPNDSVRIDHDGGVSYQAPINPNEDTELIDPNNNQASVNSPFLESDQQSFSSIDILANFYSMAGFGDLQNSKNFSEHEYEGSDIPEDSSNFPVPPRKKTRIEPPYHMVKQEPPEIDTLTNLEPVSYQAPRSPSYTKLTPKVKQEPPEIDTLRNLESVLYQAPINPNNNGAVNSRISDPAPIPLKVKQENVISNFHIKKEIIDHPISYQAHIVHNNNESPLDPYAARRCHLCSAVFSTQAVLEEHVETWPHYPCHFCKMRFFDQTEYQKHYDSRHSRRKVSLDSEANEFKGFNGKRKRKTSPVEDDNIQRKSLDVIEHGKSVDSFDKNGTSSDLSDNKEQTRIKIEKENEKEKENTPPVITKLKCHVCQAWLLGQTELNLHYKTHFQNKCTKCGEVFSRRSDLMIHILNHDQCDCKVCGKIFPHLKGLQDHLSCYCHVCGKMFKCSSVRRQHSKRKKYNCGKCGILICSREDLCEHFYSSTFECKVCEQTFTFCTEYRLHQKKHFNPSE
ncbi:zinc finger protein 184-like [Clytia hemisphaerica]|uniref:C2H2-type domain-containing protein n=1 Tax=Clytia hemisphaerica TaxID=252671 RepID=A0A7M6DM30_9CNID